METQLRFSAFILTMSAEIKEVTGEAITTVPEGLWRNAAFVKLWLGMNLSFLGTQVSSLAYPLTAVLVLHASSAQMGWLRATGTAASFLVGPFAGVIIDRVRRRPLLVFTDLGMALLAATIPLAFFAGILTMAQLYVVQFLAGGLTIFSDVGLMAYLPTLVQRGQLVRANSQVQTSSAAISIAGPGLAGALVQALSAPVVVVFDAISFVFSAVCTLLIRTPETKQEAGKTVVTNGRRSLWVEIGQGLRFVYSHDLLRPLAEGVAIHFLFINITLTLLVIYAVRQLSINPALLGIIFAALGPGFLLGALLAPRVASRFGTGRVLTYAPLLTLAGQSLIPLAGGTVTTVVVMLSVAHFLTACGIQLHGINLVSLRQAITPQHLQGRMSASFRYVNLLGACLGALVAGALSEVLGFRLTLSIGACGLLLPFLRLFFSPVRQLHEIPTAE